MPKTPDRNDIAIELLCKKAFNGNLSGQIFEEYNKDDCFIKLCQIFKKLSKVYGVKQASFGVGDIPYTQQNINMSEQAYSQAFDELTELEDRRPPISRPRSSLGIDR